jgi:hypothetical protein
MMPRAGILGHSVVYADPFPVDGSLGGLVMGFLRTFVQADLAVRQGKAIESLRDQLVGRFGIRDLIVPRSEFPLERERIVVLIDAVAGLTREQNYLVRRILDRTARRTGVPIYAETPKATLTSPSC